MSNALKPVGFHDTQDLVQNFCVKYTHNFDHKYSRFDSAFVVKGAPLTKEQALKIAEILFPERTDIIIESVENDTGTLTPSEYFFLQGVLKDKLFARKSAAEERRKENPEVAKSWDDNKQEKEYDEYLEMLIKKMQARMDLFSVYHT